jgi:hypothetical protein
MKKMTFALVIVALTACHALAGSVKSGPQPGEKVPGPFKPLHVTGPEAGKYACLYCKYGQRPVAVVFAREITPAVARLLAAIDAETAARDDARLGSFAVFVGDPARLSEPIKQLAVAQKIGSCVLSVAEAAPESYAIAADAAVTVVLYHQLKVKANHAFRAGELEDRAIAAVVADLRRMLPAK